MKPIWLNPIFDGIDIRAVYITVFIIFLPFSIYAGDEDYEIEIRQSLMIHFPNLPIDKITPSPIQNIYEISSEGAIYYIDSKGEFLIDGNIIDIPNRSNITESRKSTLQLALINSIPESDMLIYEPSIESNRSMTIFTDTTCPYCSKLHAEIDALLDAGIRIRYLLYPRAGLGSQAHSELESVWCSDDPHNAMTVVKAGRSVETISCSNPIETHVSIAKKVGLRGTPLIYLDSGAVFPGYKPASFFIEAISNSSPIQEN